jgi:hypothetical protein
MTSPVNIAALPPAQTDTTTGAFKTIDYPHAEIHSGDAYYLSYTATVADGSDIEIRFSSANTTKWPHVIFNISGTSETDVDLYETTSLTHVSGNALTPVNRNRNSSETSGMTFCHTPAGSGDGTKIDGVIFGLDTGGGATRRLAGGSASSRSELILKQNTAYLLRVTSGTDGNRISINFDWYEHVNT